MSAAEHCFALTALTAESCINGGLFYSYARRSNAVLGCRGGLIGTIFARAW